MSRSGFFSGHFKDNHQRRQKLELDLSFETPLSKISVQHK
jgi:hypothetical protein